ncbi:hypothetical protein NKG94_01480 [Micromonospora sp. M12]
MTTVTFTVAALLRAGMDEMLNVPSPFTVKQPGAGPDGQGSRTTGVPACCCAVVPISMAVAPAMFVPPTVTATPPAIVLDAGETVIPLGVAGGVPTTVVVEMPGLASVDEAVTVDWVWMIAGVTFDPVTMATTEIGGSDVPLANGALLLVHVMVCPAGAPQTQPLPKAPTGTTPVGVVAVIDTGAVSLEPTATEGRPCS